MNSEIRLFFAGDFCSRSSTSKISVSPEIKNLIRACDVRVINFEVPLRPEGLILPAQKRERFYQNDDAPDFLRDLGFNLFSIANNHVFDWGEEGYRKTKAALGKDAFGAGTYDEAYRVKIIDVKGKKIGFLALSFAAYTGVFNNVTKQDGLGCAYINDLRVNHVILEAKKDVDFLIVLPHDGIEYISIPLPETIARYRDFIDYGADAVIGTHPHCPQGWEEYKGRPIFYSLGNFLFNSKEGYNYRATNRPHWYEGLCVAICINNNAISYNVINVLNKDNTSILIDNENNRDELNRGLCELLGDSEKYNAVLAREAYRLCQSKEMPIIDHTFHVFDMKSTIKALARFVIKSVFRRKDSSDEELAFLLKNDARRQLLEHYLNRKIQ